MKKLLSIMLALAMVLSVVIIAAVPATAAEGEWTVTAQANQENGEITEDKYNSVAGYEYDGDGFHMTAANWKGQTPWARFVSKGKIDLQEGVYMEIVIDEFKGEHGVDWSDAWYNVMLTETQFVTPGAAAEGEAVQNLLRPYSATTYTTTWYTTGKFVQTAASTLDDVTVVNNDAGKQVLTVVIAWDGTTYTYTINGVTANQAIIDYMNEKWGGDNSEVYVGFCLQNNMNGGSVAASLVKFGTSADDAIVPTGDDEQAPKDYSTNHAPVDVVVNPTFEAGKPGILMTGDIENSDVKDVPGPAFGEEITPNADGTMHIVSNNTSCPTGTWVVKNATSYAIEDLPIVMMVTKNLCTCGEDDVWDDGTCGAMEESTVYLMTGNKLTADDKCMTTAETSWDAYKVGNDTYLSLVLDTNGMEEMFSGRINAVRFDIKEINLDKPGANTFDVCFIAFFATLEDANAYFEAYLTELGWENPDAGEESTEEETTVAGGDNTDETTVAGGDNTDETTVAGGNNAGDETTAGSETPAKKGCKGVVGFGAVAVVAVATVAGFVSFKKKED